MFHTRLLSPQKWIAKFCCFGNPCSHSQNRWKVAFVSLRRSIFCLLCHPSHCDTYNTINLGWQSSEFIILPFDRRGELIRIPTCCPESQPCLLDSFELHSNASNCFRFSTQCIHNYITYINVNIYGFHLLQKTVLLVDFGGKLYFLISIQNLLVLG